MISNSQPSAILGRVEPIRAVSKGSGKARKKSNQHKQPEADAIDRNAGKARGCRIVADGIEFPAIGRAVQDDGKDDGEHNEQHK